ncbi:MAG: DEAD/DEAH box helicase [Promethearchaeota archaeon]
MNLQLTYVPAKYWTNEASQFRLLSKASLPPKNSSYFIMWLPNSELENSLMQELGNKSNNGVISPQKQLEQIMGIYFPDIPAKKLLTCEILLSYPYPIQPNTISLDEIQNETTLLQLPKQKLFILKKTIAKIIPLPPAIKLLFQLQIIETKDRSKKTLQYSESIKLWAYLTKFTMELLSRGNFVPMLKDIESNLFEGQWKIILKTQLDHQRFNTILRQASWSGYNIPINVIPPHGKVKEYQTSGLWHPSYLFVEYIDTIGDFMIRESLSKKFLNKFSALYEYSPIEMETACSDDPNTPWDLRFLHACISKHREFKVSRFCDTPIPGILRNWVQNIQGFSFSYGLSFTFRLEYPKSEKSDWNLGFYLQPLHDPNYFIPLQELWGGILTHHEEYANVCDAESGLQEDTLRALGTSSKLFPPIKRALFGKAPSQVKLKAGEVMDFMRYSMYLLIQAGFNVVLPEEFAAQGQQRLSARLIIRPKKSTKNTLLSPRGSGGGGVGSPQALFDMDSMLEFHWEGTIEGKNLTEKEFLELANAREPLIFWREHWILVDQDDMENLRPIFEANNRIKGDIPYSEALKLGMMGGVKLGEGATQYDVVVEGDFNGIINQLEHIDEFIPIADPLKFQGTLRQYQQKGLTWLTHMTRLNFGICLADDMGLGKTIEVIAFLQKRQEDVPHALGSILIICPTSVLFNWHREIRKFAPNIKILKHHGPDRLKDLEAIEAFSHKHTVILTTYGTMRNDIDFLEAISFAGVVLDESQNIKNYQAQKTKAILRLKSQFRIALSGTPIENRLIELWTLFEFLNPGLLGKRALFQRKFILPIERYHDEQSADRLKRFIAPFILRRLKTDKTIIKDLPEKNEIKIYLELSPPQAALYTQVVHDTLEEMEQCPAEDVKRRGLILKLLTFTKQICNHPVQFQQNTGDVVEIILKNKSKSLSTSPSSRSPSGQNESEGFRQIGFEEFLHGSQKLERLSEMVEEILEEGEKILIFTQFKQMGDLLKSFLETKYKVPIGWFHGGVPEKRRRTLVDEFQSTAYDSMPILILSLRAGGTGLNLTQASTVFHYDRWWNPAVEDQATDRAYRIGQKHRVNVYKFIATGTIEEKIDQMLEEKRALAGAILSSKDETWITSLSNDELKELFSLSQNTEVY